MLMPRNRLVILCIFLIFHCTLSAQNETRPAVDTQWHRFPNGSMAGYTKPRSFGFLTQVPGDAGHIAAVPFKKQSLGPLLAITGTTVLLIFADQTISDGIVKFSDEIDLHASEEYKNIISLHAGKKEISLLKAPLNLNTAIYQLGQGFPSLLIGAGLFTFGKINHNYRALNTASQLAESFILMGVGTQILKRISGRESPSDATRPGGAWHFLPAFKDFQQHTPKYDAFPSGHLATMMSSVTVLADNYPELKWIRPVGYSLTGLLGYSMINNKVHWISDYPMALALGYICAKQVSIHNRKVIDDPYSRKRTTNLSLTFQYAFGEFLPGLKYSF
jgi:membrane-associated phospholipid phosphatase